MSELDVRIIARVSAEGQRVGTVAQRRSLMKYFAPNLLSNACIYVTCSLDYLMILSAAYVTTA
jgi:hypothetical protein